MSFFSNVSPVPLRITSARNTLIYTFKKKKTTSHFIFYAYSRALLALDKRQGLIGPHPRLPSSRTASVWPLCSKRTSPYSYSALKPCRWARYSTHTHTHIHTHFTHTYTHTTWELYKDVQGGEDRTRVRARRQNLIHLCMHACMHVCMCIYVACSLLFLLIARHAK
jgi:hypothetical protein